VQIEPKQKKRCGCLGCLWIGLFLFVAVFIAPFTLELLKEKLKIHQLLTHAESIRVEHFHSWVDMMAIDGSGKEQIITSKTLPRAEFQKVADAFPIGPDIGFPGGMYKCAPNPHHRIIITDASGNVTTISVCFDCDHVEIKRADEKVGDLFRTPFIWMGSLRQLFADEGMAYSPEIYRSPSPAVESEKASSTAVPK